MFQGKYAGTRFKSGVHIFILSYIKKKKIFLVKYFQNKICLAAFKLRTVCTNVLH